MAGLPTRTQQQFVDAQTASWAAYLGFEPAFQKGDPFLALIEGAASQATFLMALIQIVNALARAQTSKGADLDTFYQQFSFYRLPATTASGPATFSKFTPATSVVLIPSGTIIQTPGGAIQYQVIADTNQPAWNASLNAYVLAVGQSSVTATVQALQAGAAYNVTAGQLSQIATALPGIDSVTNGANISNGINAEGDTSYSARFVNYLNSLSKGTQGAISSALQGVAQNISFVLLDNTNTSGGFAPGQFTAVVDDGSGSPPSSFITLCTTAVAAVRGFTIQANIVAVTPVAPTVNIVVRSDGTLPTPTLEANVQAAILAYINSLGIGQTVYVSGIIDAATAVAGVVSVQPSTTTINGVAADLAVSSFDRAKTTLGSISVGTY